MAANRIMAIVLIDKEHFCETTYRRTSDDVFSDNISIEYLLDIVLDFMDKHEGDSRYGMLVQTQNGISKVVFTNAEA